MATIDQESIELDEGAALAISRSWGIVLFLGIMSVLIGILAIAWPLATVVVVAVLLSIWLIVTGIFQVIRGFSRGLSGGMRALLFISGLLSLILGIIMLTGVFRAVEILAIFIGISFLFRGMGSFFIAAEQKEGRGWNIFGGIIMVIGGFVLLLWPAITLSALAWVTGVWLVVIGSFEIFAAFRIKSLAKVG